MLRNISAACAAPKSASIITLPMTSTMRMGLFRKIAGSGRFWRSDIGDQFDLP
jgi:hypothetical protein